MNKPASSESTSRSDELKNLLTVASQQKYFRNGSIGNLQSALKDALTEWDEDTKSDPHSHMERMNEAIQSAKEELVDEYNFLVANEPQFASYPEISEDKISDAEFLAATRRFISTGEFSMPGLQNIISYSSLNSVYTAFDDKLRGD